MYKVKEKGYWKNLLLLISIAIILPLVIESIYLIFNPEKYGGSYSIFQTMPYITDDVWYFNQIKSMIAYWHPVGFYGYDGNHALLSSFGAHGWFILLPDFLFCKLFGLNYYSGTIINLGLFSVLIFLYGFLFNTSKCKTIIMASILFAPFTIYFFDGFLMESVISFWGGLCAILLSYYSLHKDNGYVKFALALVVIFASLSKVTWVVLVAPSIYVWLTQSYERGIKLKNCIACACITIIFSIIAYIFYKIFSAPYFGGTYGTDVIIEQIKNNGVIGIINVIKDIIDKIVGTFTLNEGLFYNLNAYYVLFALLLSVIWGLFNYKNNKYSFIPLFVLVADILGVIVLYYGGIIALKTITPAATFALIYMYSQSDFKFSVVVGGISILFLLGSFTYQVYYGESYTQIYNDEKKVELDHLEQYMSQIVIDSNTDNPWNNTVAFESMAGNPGDNALMLIPAGAGIMMYQKFPSAIDMQEKYIILTENNSDRLEEFQMAGYSILCEFDGNIILNK